MKTTLLFFSSTLSAILSSCSPSETKTTSTAYQSRFVPVADSVKLEVLDWGGEGQPILFLAGISMTEHTFTDFAPKFADQYHVYGLTRRGFGQSSVPKTGYDMTTLAHDILVVLDSLRIDKAILVGHSFAGDEMTRFASQNGSRFIARW